MEYGKEDEQGLHLSKRHTADNRQKLSPEYTIDAEDQKRSEQTTHRIPDYRRVLFILRNQIRAVGSSYSRIRL